MISIYCLNTEEMYMYWSSDKYIFWLLFKSFGQYQLKKEKGNKISRKESLVLHHNNNKVIYTKKRRIRLLTKKGKFTF